MTEPRPRRSLGQCFLTDPRIAQRIVGLAQLDPTARVMEIGPGRGILTRVLAAHAGEVTAVEIDPRWHARLTEEFAGRDHVHIVLGDALEYPFESLVAPFTLVANLPYYVSTPILFRVLALRASVTRMVLMLQREVVDRMVAGPGTKAYGTLSLAVAYAAHASKAFSVAPSAFTPRPDVESAVVVLTPRSVPAVVVRDEARFFCTIRAAFGHRRKILANALKDAGFRPDVVARGLAHAAIDPQRRGETLSLEEFGRLADALED